LKEILFVVGGLAIFHTFCTVLSNKTLVSLSLGEAHYTQEADDRVAT